MGNLDVMQKLGGLGAISERTVKPTNRIDRNGMHFLISSYEIDGVGCFSRIQMHAFAHLMRMDSLVLTPLRIDMPLLSFDSIHALGKDTLLLELYDTQLAGTDLSAMDEVKRAHASLPGQAAKPDWSDALRLSPSDRKTGRRLESAFDEYTAAWIDAYLALAGNAAPCDAEAKRARVAAYVDQLFTRGGVAVNQFRKMLGDEAASELIRRYVFSSEA